MARPKPSARQASEWHAYVATPTAHSQCAPAHWNREPNPPPKNFVHLPPSPQQKMVEQKLAKHAKAPAAGYAAGAGFVLIRNPGIFAGGVDMSLLRGLRELFKNSFLLQILTTIRLIQFVRD